MRMRWWWQDDDNDAMMWARNDHDKFCSASNQTCEKKCCRWKRSISLNALAPTVVDLVLHVANLYHYSIWWFMDGLDWCTAPLARPCRGPRSCPPPAWPRLGCSARTALQEDGKRETPDTKRPQRHSLCLISSCIICEGAGWPQRQHGEETAHNVGVYILNQLGVRKLRQRRFPVWSCKV